MKRFSTVFTVMAALALGACSHYSDDLSSLGGSMKSGHTTMAYNTAAPQDIAPAAGGQTTGAINTFLSRDYYELARYENDKAFDYKAAKQYTQKAVKAQKGELIVPSKISAFDVPATQVPALTSARAELISALKTQNTPENAPALAKAQTSFDCWVERAEEADEDTHFAECKNQFEQSMAMLIVPAAGDATAPTIFEIGFRDTSSIPDEASSKRIDYIVSYLAKPDNAPLKISLAAAPGEIGKARLTTVVGSLTQKGLTADRILVVSTENVMASESPSVGVQATIVGSSEVSTTTTTTTFVPVTPTPVAAQ